MADPWELILHHTYRGTPGVIYDRSPGHGSHGIALGDVQFHNDGAAPGSGAIAIAGEQSSKIHVDGGTGWDRLGAVRCEVRWRLDSYLAYQLFTEILIGCRWFSLTPYGKRYTTLPRNLMVRILPDSSQRMLVQTGYVVPLDTWVTVGFTYDEFGRLDVLVDGNIVKTGTGGPPLPGGLPTVLRIGGSVTQGLNDYHGGMIDDVKVWRRNPHAIGTNFLGRPYDKNTADCWARWGRAFAEWLDHNHDCAEQLVSLLARFGDALKKVANDPVLRTRLENATHIYASQWHTGQLTSTEMVSALAEVADILDQAGVGGHVIVSDLFQSECWKRLTSEVPPPDCDKQLTDMLTAVAQAIGEK